MFSITFSKGKCSAKQNVTNAFDALQKYIFASHFVGAKMHLMLPLHFVYKMLESGKMHLMLPLHFVYKMLESGKMHLMQKCIFAYIFLWKMFSVHFPKENVQLCKNAFDAKMLCFLLCKKQRCCPYILLVLNIFLWKMYAKMHL